VESVYEVVWEYQQVWGLSEVWKSVNKICDSFCKKLMVPPTCAANGFVEMELVENSRKVEVLELILKCWQWITCMDTEEMVKQCYEWQKDSMCVRNRAKELKEGLDSTELAFVW
jgi:hypothetical protein